MVYGVLVSLRRVPLFGGVDSDTSRCGWSSLSTAGVVAGAFDKPYAVSTISNRKKLNSRFYTFSGTVEQWTKALNAAGTPKGKAEESCEF